MEDRFTVRSAQEANDSGRLKEWVIDFLEDQGKNQNLARALKEATEILYSGPIELELKGMSRICGSVEEGLKYKDTEWETNIVNMVQSIKAGWSPPPLILTDYWDPDYHLTDGNHRCEALLRSGFSKYWTIVLNCKDHGRL